MNRFYEHKSEQLLPLRQFVRRIVLHLFASAALVLGSLFVGMLGFHFLESQRWFDAYLNAAMLLSAMGPVGVPVTDGGKFFAATYALYSGLVFVVIAGLVMAPFLHRLMHRLHLEEQD